MSVNLAIIVFIIVLLCGVAGFTMWAVQLRKPPPRDANWSPFDKHGYIDHARLKREGFHELGAIREDGPITITPPAGAPNGTIITAVCRRCGKVLRPNPGETVIHHTCQGRKDRYEAHGYEALARDPEYQALSQARRDRRDRIRQLRDDQ